MPGVPDDALIPQIMRKGHEIRAMLDDKLENALAELALARQYLLVDHEVSEGDDSEECSATAVGP